MVKKPLHLEDYERFFKHLNITRDFVEEFSKYINTKEDIDRLSVDELDYYRFLFKEYTEEGYYIDWVLQYDSQVRVALKLLFDRIRRELQKLKVKKKVEKKKVEEKKVEKVKKKKKKPRITLKEIEEINKTVREKAKLTKVKTERAVYVRTKPKRFTSKEIDFLKELKSKNVRGKEIFIRYIKKFGLRRTFSSVSTKFYRIK